MTINCIKINNNSTLYNGKSEEVVPTLEDNSIDLLITSPPYNVNLGNNKFNVNPYDLYNDNKEHFEYIAWLKDIFEKLWPKLKKGGRCAINVGDGKNGAVPTHVDIIHFMTRELNYIPMANIIWNKSQIGNRCLTGGELINTIDGYKNIEDIKIGDYVLTHKRRYKKVTHVFKNQFTGDMYKIKSYNGEEIVLTEGHKLLTFKFDRRSGKYCPKKRVTERYSWLSPEELPEEVYLAIPKYETQYHSSPELFNKRLSIITDVPINYYDPCFFRLLGYYIGDGSAHNSTIRIDFSKDQTDYAKDIEDICIKFGWKFHYENRSNVNRICISSKNILPKILKKLGGHLAKNKEIHPFLFQAPFFLQTELIKGLFRTDGSISESEATYVSISKKLTYQIRDILLRLKIGSSVNARKSTTSYINKRKINCKNSYSVRVYGKHVHNLAKIIDVNLCHSKKYTHSKVKVGSHYEFYKVREIIKENVKDITVYNLEVEEDNSYVGKVTYHNCAWGSFASPSSPSFPKPFEYIMVFAKEDKKLQEKGETDLTNKEFIDWSLSMWNITPETKMKEIGHPAAFPVNLPYRLIKMLSWKNATVLDIFNWSGTTGVACNLLGRKYIGIELSEQYCDITVKRINDVIPIEESDMFNSTFQQDN
jgi:DNA modification methylase